MNNRAEMLRKKMEDQKRYQSAQGFTVPRPSRCKDYGKDFDPEADGLKWWEKCLLAVGVVFVLVMCGVMKP